MRHVDTVTAERMHHMETLGACWGSIPEPTNLLCRGTPNMMDVWYDGCSSDITARNDKKWPAVAANDLHGRPLRRIICLRPIYVIWQGPSSADIIDFFTCIYVKCRGEDTIRISQPTDYFYISCHIERGGKKNICFFTVWWENAKPRWL